MRTRALFSVVVFLCGLSAYAQCNFMLDVSGADHLTVAPGQPYALTWQPIPGAMKYAVTETRSGFATPGQAVASTANLNKYEVRDLPRFGTVHFATDDQYFGYNITALTEDDQVLCSTSVAVLIRPSAATKTLFRRAIVPVAGSLTAADGSKFHTSLRLTITGNDGFPSTGRVIFHPQGIPASDSDPSIAYRLETLPDFNQPGATQFWDDVVATIGASGLGSIDVVPDTPDNGLDPVVPAIDARVWNDVRGQINGATVQAFRASDLLKPFSFAVRTFSVWTDGGKSRMNVGFRIVGPDYVTVQVLTHGNTRRTITLAPNTLLQMPIADLLGVPFTDGQQVTLILNFGEQNFKTAAYVYYTITENSTNDPRVFMPGFNSDVQFSFTPVSY
jgi:hypothetical protein